MAGLYTISSSNSFANRKKSSHMEIDKKRQLDMLHGPIWNKLPQFALPVAATAILEQLFNASDLAVVGNFTGAESTAAVAAVGVNSPIIGLIVNLFIGIGVGRQCGDCSSDRLRKQRRCAQSGSYIGPCFFFRRRVGYAVGRIGRCAIVEIDQCAGRCAPAGAAVPSYLSGWNAGDPAL